MRAYLLRAAGTVAHEPVDGVGLVLEVRSQHLVDELRRVGAEQGSEVLRNLGSGLVAQASSADAAREERGRRDGEKSELHLDGLTAKITRVNSDRGMLYN